MMARMQNRVMIKRIILKNLKERKDVITGFLPHLSTLAKLVPAETNEEERNRPYEIFDQRESLNRMSDRSRGFSGKYYTS